MRARGRTLIRRALVGLGLGSRLFYAAVTIHAAIYQHQAKARLEQVLSAKVETAHVETAHVETVRPLVQGELIGRVDVPRLQLAAAIAEGDDDATLGKAVGHLPDTALPWHSNGNVALAAHRDG